MISFPTFYSYPTTSITEKDVNKINEAFDKDAFLKILMAQLKYQDPLNTMNDQEFINQMSNLTTTEQIINMSKSFQNMVNTQMSLYKLNAASLVGKYVVVQNNSLSVVNGEASTVVYNTEDTSRVVVEIYDSNGKQVKFLDLGVQDPGMKYFKWDARDDAGIKVKDGVYTYKVYVIKDGKREEIGGLQGGKVEAVQFLDGKFYVIVNGERYPIETIKEISDIPANNE